MLLFKNKIRKIFKSKKIKFQRFLKLLICP